MAKLAQADKFKEVEGAMKQRAALLAVAEAAKVVQGLYWADGNQITPSQHNLDKALATLAQIQKGE